MKATPKVIRRIAVMMPHLRRLLTRTAKTKTKSVCECDKEDPRKDDDVILTLYHKI